MRLVGNMATFGIPAPHTDWNIQCLEKLTNESLRFETFKTRVNLFDLVFQ